MIIVKVPVAGLKYIDPQLKDGKIIITARYNDGIETIIHKLTEERICHWTSFRSGGTIFVQFFELSEVFGLSESERKYCATKFKRQKEDQIYKLSSLE